MIDGSLVRRKCRKKKTREQKMMNNFGEQMKKRNEKKKVEHRGELKWLKKKVEKLKERIERGKGE